MVLNKSAEFAPMLACFENFSHEALQKLPMPQVLHTHLPLRFLPQKKYDVAVSFEKLYVPHKRLELQCNLEQFLQIVCEW
ncbi:hypothetical protein KUTeg_008789 [Tegillarca granosa]|uniref:Uncharacterized protein n=1 Tax=Tegillarca granosa TaxID=220873 RepID=A0ABQ9FA52_TEGGR|nr:hypothetical protein KUTeg_008789 [Tegillarca granosa]